MNPFDMKTDGKKCPKCGSTNTHDHWYNPDDHGLMIYHNWRCHDCGWDDSKKPMTNADKIRAMSDEELAELLDMKDDCTCIEHYCPAYTDCRRNKDWRHTTCQQTILDWLKQEATNE